jgi:hypothetical protein
LNGQEREEPSKFIIFPKYKSFYTNTPCDVRENLMVESFQRNKFDKEVQKVHMCCFQKKVLAFAYFSSTSFLIAIFGWHTTTLKMSTLGKNGLDASSLNFPHET